MRLQPDQRNPSLLEDYRNMLQTATEAYNLEAFKAASILNREAKKLYNEWLTGKRDVKGTQ